MHYSRGSKSKSRNQKSFERQWKNGKKCTVVTPGTQSRDFTHVEDIVSGLSITALRDDNYEWHLRSGINVSIIDLAEMYGEWEIIPERRGERFTSEEFPSDTEEKLGWKPNWKVDDWVKLIKNNLLYYISNTPYLKEY